LHPAEFGSFVAIVNRHETAGRWRLALVGCGDQDSMNSRGYVDAADEESAIEAAAKGFRISDMPRNRLIA